jgi:RNA polymerase sigma-70 factor, ECF subfamily
LTLKTVVGLGVEQIAGALVAQPSARVDDAGDLVPLEQQDRAKWDKTRIVEGLRHLDHSAHGDQASSYHLEAGIAAYHAIAPSYRETEWRQILDLYNRLLAIKPSPIVALNRAVALSQCDGVAAGIHALETIRTSPPLQRYYLLWATLAKLHADAGDVASARGYYRQALDCPCSTPERRFLERSLAALA